MKRITFEKISNPNVIAYSVVGITPTGVKEFVAQVDNPIGVTPIPVTFKLTSKDVINITKVAITYGLKYDKLIKNMSDSTIVIYDDERVSNDLIVVDTTGKTITINEGIPRSAELTATMYIDGIEFICEEEYKDFIIKPVIDAQTTSIGYHSKLV